MRKTTLALSALASLRLTRFITTDTLGDWLIVRPAKTWAVYDEGGDYVVHEDMNGVELSPIHPKHAHIPLFGKHGKLELDPERGPRSKLVSALECPFCVGFWVGAATLVAGALSEHHPLAHKLFKAVSGSLGLNYITGHISARLDS